MKHAFGSVEPFSLGLEEELLLVDREKHALAHVAEQVLPAMGLPEEAAGYEAHAAELELRSPPCGSAGEAVEVLASRRAAARAAGATLMGCGLHPAAELGDAVLVGKERYRGVEREMRGLILRTPECALHVHVAMPDEQTAIRVFNGLREWLPLFQGLAAASPWWFGLDSGMASARAAVVRSYPGRGVPRAFEDFDDYRRTVAAVSDAGGPDDYTLLWWDLRPHPRLGTVELREMDSQSRLADAGAIAALARGLAAHHAGARPEVPSPSEVIAWSAFRAARDGLDAELSHGGGTRPLPAVAREAVQLAGAAAGDAALEGVERILDEGGGADRQRAAHARGGMPELLRLVVEETAGG